MSLKRERDKYDGIPFRKIGLGRFFTKTRGNLKICCYGIEHRLPKFKGRTDWSQIRENEKLCHNMAQATCTNCLRTYCSHHLDKHRLSCFR